MDNHNMPEGRAEKLLATTARYKVSQLLAAIGNSFETWPQRWCIAGGALNSEHPNDIDCFPLGPSAWLTNTLSANAKPILKTPNALTVKYNDYTIQFCAYTYATLAELIESFDFTHCQIGVELHSEKAAQLCGLNADTEFYNHSITNTYCSQQYIEWKLTGRTEYVGSNYPISSMLRAGKYWKQGLLTSSQRAGATLNALTDTVERGFYDYEDFKDQLDAVDLGIVIGSEDFTNHPLFRLYELLYKPRKTSDGQSDSGYSISGNTSE